MTWGKFKSWVDTTLQPIVDQITTRLDKQVEVLHRLVRENKSFRSRLIRVNDKLEATKRREALLRDEVDTLKDRVQELERVIQKATYEG